MPLLCILYYHVRHIISRRIAKSNVSILLYNNKVIRYLLTLQILMNQK